MMPTDPAVDDAARAILDGATLDWTGLESSDDQDTRSIAEQLKVLSAVAGVHRAEATPTAVPSLAVSPPDQPDRLRQWGHLQLLEKVGAGAFGEVYRAWDARLDREVALKLLPARATPDSSPIIEEGRLIARVRHPNVATIYGAESIDNRVGLWMEFVRGRTLEQLLRTGHQFSLPEVVGIGLQLCHAVSAVHAAGLLHRDIKTQNVMRADDGRIVLMDFGTGRDLANDSTAVAGTPLYLAPEVFRGQAATVRSDVYSVGVLLYRLLTGAYPTKATSLEDVRRAHDSNERVDLGSVRPDLPQAVLLVVRRAMDSDPERRYRSCDALAADLQPLMHHSRARRWLMTAGLVAAGLAMVVWAGWNGRGRPAIGSAAGAGVAAAKVPGDRPIIAVRPFRNLNADANSEFIADGLTYELIRNLAIIDGLDVRSATSSFTLKGKEIALADIGQRLGVNLVLEGSVFRSGDHLRVQAQLTRVAGDTPLWTEKFDRSVTDVLAIQDEISRKVVNQLRLTLGRGQRRYGLNPAAQELYLQARTLTERRGTGNAQAAVQLFGQVIALDPAFAPAYAGLCDAYGFMSQNLPDVLGLPHQQALTLMRATAQKAIELDPMLAEAHAAMGFLYSRENAWDEAVRSFRRALEINPSLLHVYTSYSLTTLLPLGRFAEDEALLQAALLRDPYSLEVKRELALLYLTSGRFQDAIQYLEQVKAVDANYEFLPLLLARAQSLAGRIDEAMPYWESVSTQVGSQHWLAYAYVRAGRRAEVERLAAEHTHPYRLAILYAALGNKDRALEALDRAADEAPQRTVRLLQYPELAALRGDPRFEAIRAKFHLH